MSNTIQVVDDDPTALDLVAPVLAAPRPHQEPHTAGCGPAATKLSNNRHLAQYAQRRIETT